MTLRDESDIAGEEPQAEAREGAREVRQIYVALRKEGFTEQQSLVILGQMLAAAVGGQG